MKKLSTLVLLVLSITACQEPAKQAVKTENNRAYFNQVNTSFTDEHIQCLYAQWHSDKFTDTTYKDVGIALSVIDDAQAYQALFSCGPNVTLPNIDFRSKSLLVGVNATFKNRVNTPIRIKKIAQNFARTDSGNFYHITVAGSASDNESGGEWFGFTALVPKIQGEVTLNMSYVFK